MALIQCSECGKEISDQIAACPHCGYPVQKQTYSVWAAPTWPVKLCLFVGLVLLAIQAVSEILKHVEGLVTASANGKEAQG